VPFPRPLDSSPAARNDRSEAHAACSVGSDRAVREPPLHQNEFGVWSRVIPNEREESKDVVPFPRSLDSSPAARNDRLVAHAACSVGSDRAVREPPLHQNEVGARSRVIPNEREESKDVAPFPRPVDSSPAARNDRLGAARSDRSWAHTACSVGSDWAVREPPLHQVFGASSRSTGLDSGPDPHPRIEYGASANPLPPGQWKR